LKVESEISGLKNETQKEQQTAEELAQKLRKCQANLEA
jgi:hypothetical protein